MGQAMNGIIHCICGEVFESQMVIHSTVTKPFKDILRAATACYKCGVRFEEIIIEDGKDYFVQR